MSGLWTNDRDFADRVHRAISVLATGTEDSHDQSVLAVVHGITSAVRVLDPDDPEWETRVAEAIYEAQHRVKHVPADENGVTHTWWRLAMRDARAALEALRQP
jgi:hypothetical protein